MQKSLLCRNCVMLLLLMACSIFCIQAIAEDAYAKELTTFGDSLLQADGSIDLAQTEISVTSSSNSWSYTGASFEKQVVVTVKNGEEIIDPSNYVVQFPEDMTNAGKKTITILPTESSCLTGSATKAITIEKLPISKLTRQMGSLWRNLTGARLKLDSATYTGSPIQQDIPELHLRGNTSAGSVDLVVKEGDETLGYSKGEWQNNVACGVASITITGLGNLTDDVTFTFDIIQANIADALAAKIPDQVYTGSSIEPLVDVAVGERQLSSETDYDVSYVDNIEPGEATYIVTGKGNYSGELRGGFSIKRSVADASIVVEDQVWTGQELKPDVVVTLDNTPLTIDDDYTVEYANNVDEGEATVTVKGADNYMGERTVTFKIEKSADQKAADEVAALIAALPSADAATADTKAAADAAKAALANLTPEQLALLPEGSIDTLTAVSEAADAAKEKADKALRDSQESGKVVSKKANPITVKAKTVKAKAAKKTVVKKAKAFTVKKAQGKVTFKKVSGNKKITVSKAGKVTVKKGLKRGKTYKVKVEVTAAGNNAYKPSIKTVALKVKVK